MLDALKEQGLHDPSAWSALLRTKTGRAGRGATACTTLSSGERLRLKQLRRGGALGFLWRDRFYGTRRLLANLDTPLAAAERGIPTPAPVALLLAEGPRRCFRGWIAFEEIAAARDLIDRWTTGHAPEQAELELVISLVRQMHAAGLEHRDLNLGNILLRTAPGGSPEALVIDLDRARLHDRPLRFGLRQRALRRIERSYLKWFGGAGAAAGVPVPPWYELYAADDAELRRRLSKGRRIGRALLYLHRRR
jgi:hypothetical protein